jgi:hypothetical protein
MGQRFVRFAANLFANVGVTIVKSCQELRVITGLFADGIMQRRKNSKTGRGIIIMTHSLFDYLGFTEIPKSPDELFAIALWRSVCRAVGIDLIY